ncbi:VCBS repeat-containing protein [Streptomyces sp. NPDC007863]|uniref:FG-GAP repeat domain-containing protein n=1 Tax=Streptomyces sp. NPDC007863 TaxID=3154894 RepID=UPI0033F2E2F5
MQHRTTRARLATAVAAVLAVTALGAGTLAAAPAAFAAPSGPVAEPVTVLGSQVPATVNLDRTGGEVTLGWTLSDPAAYILVTLTHTATGRQYQQFAHSPTGDEHFSFAWDGHIGDVDGPNGAYAVEAEVTPLDGVTESTYARSRMTLSRTPNPHDHTNNGSTDVLARDAAGVLWRDDLRDRPVNGLARTAQRTRIGSGWNTYRQIEAVGSTGGAAHGDLVALDGSGVLWHYLGKGDGTFTPRTRIGAGWGAYNKITGGSDLDGDGRSDLLATDTSGVLWSYKGTGDGARPFATRVRVGGGWGVYDQLTAVGDIAGAAAGDLVARGKDGVLWLYLGKGDGTFAGRIHVGGGWGAFSQLVGAGDVDADGRPDLVAYGAGGTFVYRSTGSGTRPFVRMGTDLYAGQGTRFTAVA